MLRHEGGGLVARGVCDAQDAPFPAPGSGRADPGEAREGGAPMTALCHAIEINLRQMLGETDLPPAVQPVDGFLY